MSIIQMLIGAVVLLVLQAAGMSPLPVYFHGGEVIYPMNNMVVTVIICLALVMVALIINSRKIRGGGS